MLSKEQIKSDLNYFTGSETFYQYYPNVIVTEGVQYLIENANCEWLVNLVHSYQIIEEVRKEVFQVFDLKCDLENFTGKVICTDGNENCLMEQNIPFTDFPLDKIRLYYTNKTLLLPSEY